MPPTYRGSGSVTHFFQAGASTTAGPTAGESTAGTRLLALRWHRQFLSVRKVLGCVNAAPVLSVDRIHPQESNPASLN